MTFPFEILAINPSPLVVQELIACPTGAQEIYGDKKISSLTQSMSLVLAAAQAGYLGITDLVFTYSGADIADCLDDIFLPTLASGDYPGSLGIRITTNQLAELNVVLERKDKQHDNNNGQQEKAESKKENTHTGKTLTIIVVPGTVARTAAINNQELAKSIKQIRTCTQLANYELRILVEIISSDEAKLASKLDINGILAKGHEASGLVGESTAFVLMQECLRLKKTPVYVWGGIGLHTAAACYAAGAQGVILDSQLLLAKESPIPVTLKAKIEQFDGTETHIIPLSGSNAVGEPNGDNLALRVYTRPNHSFTFFENDQTKELPAIYQRLTNHNAQNSPLNWVVPIGQDIAFAQALAQKYISVAGILHAVKEAVDEHIALARSLKPLAAASPLAQSHGTIYPIVQGAMTRVSDKAQFAHEVAKAGGLPFLALALMRGAESDALLSETKTLLHNLSWGVGILGFVPNQLRQEQLAVIEKYKPPFVLIAGGRPDQAKSLEDQGIKAYLHVPSPLLLDSFMEMGSRRFIFEGRECGGHVGPRSSFVLWETMIEHLLNNIGAREDASLYHVIFAGGIHDAKSAAAIAALAAPLAARGVRIGVLMGTAYLFTEEAVNSGAIVQKFQTAALDCQKTVLLETGPGHAIRCINSPYKLTFDRKRQKLADAGKSKEEIREELELMNLGRLRLASKGMIRAGTEGSLNEVGNKISSRDQIMAEFAQPENDGTINGDQDISNKKDKSSLEFLSEDQQWSHGMYMIGQVASMHNATLTVAQLHEDVSKTSTQLIESFPGSAFAEKTSVQVIKELNRVPNKPVREAIAIIGMSCLFPKAKDLHAYWCNILDKVDAIEEVPLHQWDWKNYYDADPQSRDKIYSKWGGFLEDIQFDPTKYGIPPSSLSSVDPMQLLLLEVTDAALKDAGYGNKPFPREKTSVILANAGHGPITAFYSLRSMLGWKLAHLDPAIKAELEEALPEWTEDSFPGYLGNVTAGRVANRFDLGGVNFCIDAACASSLAALYTAVAELRNAKSDLVFLCATDTHNQPGDYLSFSKTHAFSADGHCKTFDASADGIVISEGMAMLVLKRLSDAERDGDRIYAVVKGIGGSSDGRDLSLTAPRPAGQIKALRRAYEDAEINPSTVTLIEAHGTGTVAGDKAEVEALKQVFEEDHAIKQSCAIGSVKTMIGHTKAAAGLASLIKVAKALHHKVLPPTIGIKTPNPACHFENGPFYINSETRPWLLPPNSSLNLRRAGVSAFGFGGTNFHTVLEEYQPAYAHITSALEDPIMSAELFVFAASSKAEMIRSLSSFEDKINKVINEGMNERLVLASLAYWQFLKNSEFSSSSAERFCLALVATNITDLKEKLSRAREEIQSDNKAAIKDPRGVYFKVGPAKTTDKLAFLFPGQGSQYPGMLSDLAVRFGEVAEVFAQANDLLHDDLQKPLSEYVFPLPVFTKEENQAYKEALTNTRIAQPAIGVANMAMRSLLKALAIKPDMVAGHSYGEYVALCVGGYLDFPELIKISAQRGKILGQPIDGQAIPGAMAAVACSAAEFSKYLSQLPQSISVANFNSPKQTVIGASEQDIEQSILILQEQGLVARRIPVSQAFHTQSMKGASEKLVNVLKEIKFSPGTIDVYSNLDGQKYDRQPHGIDLKLGRHTIAPVDFVKEIGNMYADGARIFLEVGPSNVLCNLAESILDNNPGVSCISLDRQGRDGITSLLHALAQLTVNGVNIDCERLYKYRLSHIKPVLDASSAVPKSSNLKINKKLVYLVNSAQIRPRAEFGKTVASSMATNKNISVNEIKIPQNDNLKNRGLVDLKTSSTQAKTNHFTNSPTRVRANNYSGNNATAAGGGNSSVDQVMLEFQQTMQQMSNSFLETQERVMLAYLENQQPGVPSSSAVGISSASDALAIDNSSITSVSQFSNTISKTENAIDNNGADREQETAASSRIAVDNKVLEPESTEIIDTEYLVNTLLEIVAERTGYPVDMIDPTLDLEADLGIDSIKRVEILNKFRRVLPETKQKQLESGIEELAGTRTLQGIIDWLRANQSDSQVQESLPMIALSEMAIHQMPANNNGGNGQHESVNEIKIEQQGDQQYIQAKETTTSALAAVSALSHASHDLNGHNGKGKVTHTTPSHNGNGKEPQEIHRTGEQAVNSLNIIRRATVSTSPLPELPFTKEQLEIKSKEVQKRARTVLITADQSTLAISIAELLRQYGFNPIILEQSSVKLPADNNKQIISANSYAIDLQNYEQVQSLLDRLQNDFGNIAMLFHLQSFAESSAELNRASAISLLHLLKYLSLHIDKNEGQRLLTVTSMGGQFGGHQTLSSSQYSPVQAAVAGLIKVALKELPKTLCKAIDFDFTDNKSQADISKSAQLNDIANRLLCEALLDEGTTEVGYCAGERLGITLAESKVKSDFSEKPLDESSVVLITGGARGITADIACELAQRYKPILILIGRSTLPDGDEDPRYAGLTGVRELKAKIIEELRENGKPVNIPQVESKYQTLIKEREIRNNIQKLKALASKVEYCSLDVQDSGAFRQLIERVYRDYGKINALIHGAGIIEDALLKDKDTESFQRVFDTKVNSALTLINSLKLESLKYLFFFSSVVGRTGNAGQSDYVAANEVLNKLACSVRDKVSGRTASIMWGPWRGGMAQPELEAIFAQYGWAMIDVPMGCAAFIDEMFDTNKNEPEVLLVAEPKSKHEPQSKGARLHKSQALINSAGDREYNLELDTQVDAFLQDHAFGDVPVLPMAYALELMCEAAHSTYPDFSLKMIERFDIPAGILFDSPRKQVSIVVHEEEKKLDSAVAFVSIISGQTKRRVNFRARFVMSKSNTLQMQQLTVPMILNSNSPSHQFEFGKEIILPSIPQIYKQWLFHGPRFQGIQTIDAVGEQGVLGGVSGLNPERCLHLQPSENWIIDPVMFDSAMQLGGIWARNCFDITVLPTGFTRLLCFAQPDCQPSEIFTAYILIRPTDSNNELICDLAIYHPSGKLCILVEGLSGVGSKSLHRLANQNASVQGDIPR